MFVVDPPVTVIVQTVADLGLALQIVFLPVAVVVFAVARFL